ncbi:hypothetical protein DH2020_018757 [Rehmannia glutinosa]|uniref:protein-serine/threonine phosphatase n=1 Tax=Rehmannia glutinosa TaxID=99300 RepID=A0ABR0WL07_REHGL
MGVYLSTPSTEKVSEDGENDNLRYGLSSMQGWRATMEDAHAAFSNLDGSTSFFGVYDGHGGKEVSKFCAKFLHKQVLEHEAYAAGDLGTSVRKAFLRMDQMMCGRTGQKELALLRGKEDKPSGSGENVPKNDEVNRQTDCWPSEEDKPCIYEYSLFKLLLNERIISIVDIACLVTLHHDSIELTVMGIHSDYQGPSAGSTACVTIIQNNQLLVANAGDSRCVKSRKGQAHDLSKDHKPDIALEKRRILEAGGYVQYGRVNGSLNLARAIGDMEMKQNRSLPAEKQIVTADPDIVTLELSEDDEFLIIACDGIWDCMSSQQAVDFVKEQLKTEGCDNMTMILVQFKKPLDTKPSSKEQPESSVQ